MKFHPPCQARLAAIALLLVTIAGVGCSGKEELHLAGTVERTTLELAAPVSETITDIPVSLGQRIEAGDVVVLLDTTVAEAELKASEAGLEAATATLNAAQRELGRAETLRSRGVSSAQDYDRRRRERDEARAMAAEREARIAQTTKRLEDLTIRTHAAGVVDQLPFEVGERSAAGGVVAVVVSHEKPWVRVWIPARVVSRLVNETTAEVRVEGLDQVFKGRVTSVATEAEFTPHYALTERESAHLVYQARVVLDSAPQSLRPGLPAQVKIVVSSKVSTKSE